MEQLSWKSWIELIAFETKINPDVMDSNPWSLPKRLTSHQQYFNDMSGAINKSLCWQGQSNINSGRDFETNHRKAFICYKSFYSMKRIKNSSELILQRESVTIFVNKPIKVSRGLHKKWLAYIVQPNQLSEFMALVVAQSPVWLHNFSLWCGPLGSIGTNTQDNYGIWSELNGKESWRQSQSEVKAKEDYLKVEKNSCRCKRRILICLH